MNIKQIQINQQQKKVSSPILVNNWVKQSLNSKKKQAEDNSISAKDKHKRYFQVEYGFSMKMMKKRSQKSS